MSRANLYVLFPDGEVKYGIYNGTSDVALPFLVDTPDKAWDMYEADRKQPFANSSWWSDFEKGAGAPVFVATDLGRGSSWPATATKTRLTSAYNSRDSDDVSFNGLPSWATYAAPIPDQWPTEEDQ